MQDAKLEAQEAFFQAQVWEAQHQAQEAFFSTPEAEHQAQEAHFQVRGYRAGGAGAILSSVGGTLSAIGCTA